MKYNSNTYRLLNVVLAVFAGVLCVAWLAAPPAMAAALWVRIVLCASLAGIALAAIQVARLRQSYEHKMSLQFIRRLRSSDAADAVGSPAAVAMPALGANSPWLAVLREVRDCVESYVERLQAAEHARASTGIRIKRLAAERQQMTDILAGLSDPVLAIDHYDEVVLANPSAEVLLGFDAEKTEGRALDNLVRCEELVNLLTETRRHQAPVRRSLEIPLKNGGEEPTWYRATCNSIATGQVSRERRGAGGERSAEGQERRDEGSERRVENRGPETAPHGAVAVLTDVSGQKAMQKRNAEFVSSVSHEMKTPLASIKAYVELLADGEAEDEETREEFLGVINSQTDRLQRLIDNLLNLARIEAGVVEVDKQQRSLNELLEEAFGVVQPAAEAKQIQLTEDLSPMYLGVLADRDMLLQAAINLLSNAVKYTSPGGRVTLRSRMSDDHVQFEVEDTGVGLSPEDRDRVFDKFYRVKKDQQMAAGTGLGLPLAKHIVEDVHGGQLTVESELGNGSTFRATLPGRKQIDT